MTRGSLDDETLRPRDADDGAARRSPSPRTWQRQVVVLASDVLSGHVTGQLVTVAGGMEGRVLRD